MTSSIAVPRTARLVAVALAAFVLAGCSATHVGESWQCPLAQGAECASVAAADPALPEPAAEGAGTDLGDPLYRERLDAGVAGTGAIPDASTCDAGCGPFAWVARLLRWDDDEAASSDEAGPHGEEPGPVEPDAAPVHAGAAFAPDGGPDSVTAVPAPGTDAQQAEHRAGDAAPGEPVADEALREAEVIGRIWIAPYAGADGIYREGHFVRAVLAPAAWRLP